MTFRCEWLVIMKLVGKHQINEGDQWLTYYMIECLKMDGFIADASTNRSSRGNNNLIDKQFGCKLSSTSKQIIKRNL